MVQFSPATREARVRFPADAHVLPIFFLQDEVHIQEFVAQQLHSVKARLQVLRNYSISTSDSEEETIMKIKCISSAQVLRILNSGKNRKLF